MERELTSEAFEIIDQRLAGIGLTLAQLCADSAEVAIFGSFGFDSELDHRDVDIFVVGNFDSRITNLVDLLCLSPSSVRRPSWLESEVAGHILAYGTWLKGIPDWLHNVRHTHQTVQRKISKVRLHANAVFKTRSKLRAPYLSKHAMLIRRHLQRLEYLLDERAVPPTIALRDEWDLRSCKDIWLSQILDHVPLSSDEKSFVKKTVLQYDIEL